MLYSLRTLDTDTRDQDRIKTSKHLPQDPSWDTEADNEEPLPESLSIIADRFRASYLTLLSP